MFCEKKHNILAQGTVLLVLYSLCRAPTQLCWSPRVDVDVPNPCPVRPEKGLTPRCVPVRRRSYFGLDAGHGPSQEIMYAGDMVAS